MKLILDRIKNGIETIKDPLCDNVHSYGRIEVDSETCNLCGLCEKECPVNAISIMDGKLELDSRKCIFCKLCIDVCPNDSLEMTHDYKMSAIEELGEETRREVYSAFQRSLTLRAVDVGSCNGCFLEFTTLRQGQLVGIPDNALVSFQELLEFRKIMVYAQVFPNVVQRSGIGF